MGRTDKEISERVVYTMGFHPNVPYRPVSGLVALFARQPRVRETLERLIPIHELRQVSHARSY
jgi:hypothetical protein